MKTTYKEYHAMMRDFDPGKHEVWIENDHGFKEKSSYPSPRDIPNEDLERFTYYLREEPKYRDPDSVPWPDEARARVIDKDGILHFCKTAEGIKPIDGGWTAAKGKWLHEFIEVGFDPTDWKISKRIRACKNVPLGPEDFLQTKGVRLKDWSAGCWNVIISVSPNSVAIMGYGGYEYDRLLEEWERIQFDGTILPCYREEWEE